MEGEIVEDSSCISFLVKKKLSKKRLNSEKSQSVLVPALLRPRSQELWGAVAGTEVTTDVLEVGPLSGFSARFNPGDVLGFTGGSGYGLLAAVVEQLDDNGSTQLFALSSGHAAPSPNSKDVVLFDLATAAQARASLSYIAAPGIKTLADAALLVPEPGVIPALLAESDQGTVLRGQVRTHGTGYQMEDLVEAAALARGQRYDAVARGREVKSIPIVMVRAIIRDVSLRGSWPLATYYEQIVTPKFLLPGESGSILHSDGRAAGMLNGGTTSMSNIQFPANFWSPIEHVLSSLLASSGARQLSFVQPQLQP